MLLTWHNSCFVPRKQRRIVAAGERLFVLKTALKTLSVALLLGGSALTSAATITVVQTLDLSQLDLSSSAATFNSNSLDSGPFNVFDGDTIDFTLKFVGNQSLKVTNLSTFYGVVYNPNGIGGSAGVGTVNFLNATGPINSSFGVNYGSACCHHLGPILQANQFITGPGQVEFSGIRTVVTYGGFGGTTIYGFLFGAFTDNGSFEAGTNGGEGPVDAPEPAALVLLGGGLLGLAGLRRRRAA